MSNERSKKVWRSHTRRPYRAYAKLQTRMFLNREKLWKLTDLQNTYITCLQDSPYPNPNYQGENFKSKLQEHVEYKDKLSFCNMGCFKLNNVHSSNIDTELALKRAYELGSSDMIKDVGTHLLKLILDGFANSTKLKWPPVAQTLWNQEAVIPKELETSLSYILAGKQVTPTVKTRRLVYYIRQDKFCWAAMNRSWKLPKHILICSTSQWLN